MFTLFQPIMILYVLDYGFFDEGNIDGFGAKLAIHQNFLFQ